MAKHRKTRGVYDEALNFENVYKAWKTVSHTCKNKRGVMEFGLFAHARAARILADLKNRNYYPNRFRCFMIFEPKARLVMSQSIRDKIVNHFVANEYLIPLLESTLIDANVATRKEKGASYAYKLVRRYFAQLAAEKPGAKIYALKMDVSKYFYSIDHEMLFKMLKKKIKDKDVLMILKRIVDETNQPYINKTIDAFNRKYGTDIPHYEKDVGLSIGAVTSQFLAIFYLSDLDRKIKEVYKCKYYIRYMDDLVIWSHDREWLAELKEKLIRDLEGMKLKANPKSRIYECGEHGGFTFLGYRPHIDVKGRYRVICLASTVRRIRARLSWLEGHDFDKYGRSYEAYRGYFYHSVPAVEVEALVGEKRVETEL
ncbi:hypothetical protein IJG29_01920 [Candidatus Saccharibacteria bacterium]|nr:hypothetical protein [Candidatus Saccharibacteria bacterium]